MTNQIAVSNTQAVVGSFTQTELDTIKGTIAKGTSNEQFSLFVQTCVASGLNPFLNQIYCIVYNGNSGPVMSIQIAVEGIVALAKKHPHYKGFLASEVKENDHFEIDMITGIPVHKVTTLQRGKTIGAYCVAYREGMPNISVVVDLDQVSHLINSSVANTKKMWNDYRDDMLVKSAIKRAFKRQFGIEVAEDEPIQGESADNIAPYERKDITPDAVQEPLKELEAPEEKPAAAQVTDMAKVRGQISTAFKKLGITTDEEKTAYMAENCKVKGDKPTLAELKGLLKIMEMAIEDKNDGLGELE